LKKIGQRVRALREKLGITQADLASRMGFVRNYISLVENGRSNPSRRFVRALELIEQAPSPNNEHTSPVREEPFAASNTCAALIKARRKELGLTVEDLARLTGFSRSMIRSVEGGRARAGEKLLRQLSIHLNLPVDELRSTPAYRYDAGLDREQPAGLTTQSIPLLTWAEAASARAWEDSDQHENFIGFNVRDPKAVAVQILGDNMAPQFPQGTIAIVYPGWEAKNGNLVIARHIDGTVRFNRLHVDGAHYTFISLNSIYPPVTIEKSKIDKLFPVGGTFQNHL
jgi:transcriptional regulator with XRE-family HTH domain